MKGINVNLAEVDRVFNEGIRIKPKRARTRQNFIKWVNEIVVSGKMPITEIPAENIRATYATQIDAPIVSRFNPGPYRI